MKETEALIFLLFCIALLRPLSQRMKLPFPILLVLTGLFVSIIPGIPLISLQSEIIFPLFLPPLLFYTAWNISWCTFKRHLRLISLASISLVIFIVFGIGTVIHWLMPSIGWPVCILLAAILSPPDAVAATAIVKDLGLQPRLITILEGESLINDASALLAFKYALGFVLLTANFSLASCIADFLTIFIGGLGVGFLIGYGVYLLHRRTLRDAIVSSTILLLTPFTCYLIAERLHFSGVLAVVTAGLYLSFRADKMLTMHSRIKGYAVWDVLSFILNGLVFILIGLQVKQILNQFSFTYILYLLAIALVLMVASLLLRFLWTVPNTLFPRFLSKRIREREPFDRRNIFVFAWAGMKGIVSMTVALSLPHTIPGELPFPFRSEIIFLTFFVILFTLVFQGLTLPLLIKKLKMPKYSMAAEEAETRTYLIMQIQTHIEQMVEMGSEELRFKLKEKYALRQRRLSVTQAKNVLSINDNSTAFSEFAKMELAMLATERTFTYLLRREGKVTEEVLHKIEREIDLEEARIRLEIYEEVDN